MTLLPEIERLLEQRRGRSDHLRRLATERLAEIGEDVVRGRPLCGHCYKPLEVCRFECGGGTFEVTVKDEDIERDDPWGPDN